MYVRRYMYICMKCTFLKKQGSKEPYYLIKICVLDVRQQKIFQVDINS